MFCRTRLHESDFALNLGHIATAMLPRFMTKSDSCKRALDSHLFLNNLLIYSMICFRGVRNRNPRLFIE